MARSATYEVYSRTFTLCKKVAAVAAAMDQLVSSGKTRYWGVSNHCGNEVQEYVAAAAAAGTAPPAGTEDYYNIAGNQLMDSGRSRTAWLERDLFPVTRKAGLGLIAFSPVDCGALAPGKEGGCRASWRCCQSFRRHSRKPPAAQRGGSVGPLGC